MKEELLTRFAAMMANIIFVVTFNPMINSNYKSLTHLKEFHIKFFAIEKMLKFSYIIINEYIGCSETQC